jgi:FtsP/CotA-like multicopper oxidase with cupredoxin domain
MKKIKAIAWIAFAFGLLGFIIYKIALNSFTDNFLGKNPQHTKAVIIDVKNFMGNQPVDPKFSYSYSFKVNGRVFTGNAHDTTLKVGDSVEVEYNEDHPSINKPLHPKE